MMKAASIVALTMVLGSTLTASLFCQTPAAVHSFVPGSGQSSGQEPHYFPANVLGLPDPTARRGVPAIDPRQIASLGMGGEITLRFDAPVVDGPGADFTVFENAFYYTVGPNERLYAEPAEVSVSRDGITFIAYPFDSLTLAGCAGVAPTNGDMNPFDPSVSGGNSFDLAALGIDSVRFVRLRDVTALVAADPTHPFWDATLSGFDLDAVVAIPVENRTTASAGAGVDRRSVSVAPNPASSVALIAYPDDARSVRVRDLVGRLLIERHVADGSTRMALDVSSLSPGLYVVEIERTRSGARDQYLRATSMLRVVR